MSRIDVDQLQALRRWKACRAQWVVILSGARSGLAGTFLIKRANVPSLHGLAEIVPYAAFGAL